MDIRQLETFLWIARLGSISEACKRLHVTQSTLSMRLSALEADLGLPLFDRAHKRLTLNAKGRELVRYAEKIMETVEQVRLRVADPKSQSGRLRVGVSELVALTWAPGLLHLFSAAFPNIAVDMDVGLPKPLTESLSAGSLDVVLAPSLTPPQVPFVGFPLGKVRYEWMASPSLGLPSEITPHDLEEVAVINVATGQSLFFALIEQWFADSNCTISRLSVCNGLATSASMVSAGMGVSLLPLVYCAGDIASGKLKVLQSTCDFNFDYYAICRSLGDQLLPRKVAQLAQKASTFDATTARGEDYLGTR